MQHSVLVKYNYLVWKFVRSSVLMDILELKGVKILYNKMNFIIETLTLLLSVSCWLGANTELPSNSNISKMVGVNIAFIKKYLMIFLIICSLIDLALVVL